MKFLLDMNLSPAWLAEFERRGIEAVHWSEVGNHRATDSEIMEYARDRGFVVFTHDLDFGAILAATGASSPSVVQVRVHDVTPESLAPRFFMLLEEYAERIMDGALIVIDLRQHRVRVLPLFSRGPSADTN